MAAAKTVCRILTLVLLFVLVLELLHMSLVVSWMGQGIHGAAGEKSSERTPAPRTSYWPRSTVLAAVDWTALLSTPSPIPSDAAAVSAHEPPPTASAPQLLDAATLAAGEATTVAANSSKLPQLDSARVAAWSGRLGNNIHQLGHALVFAKQNGLKRVLSPPVLPEDEGQSDGWWRMNQYFSLPSEFVLREVKESWRPALDEARLACPTLRNVRTDYEPGSYFATWWLEYCCDVPAEEYRRALQEHMRPVFSKRFSSCVKTDDSAVDDELLTIHIRGEDLWPMDVDTVVYDDEYTYRLYFGWQQPPCSMYKKAILEGGFKRFLVVTSPDYKNPCVGWLKEYAALESLEFQVKSTDMPLEDACELLNARNLVLSYSTFADSMALLSRNLRRIYVRREFMAGSMMNCHVWPGVELIQYDVPINGRLHVPYNSTYRGLNHWMLTFPLENITPTCS